MSTPAAEGPSAPRGSGGGRPRVAPGFRVVAWLVIAVVRGLRWRIVTHGIEHVPVIGGAVIVWNHHGHLDLAPTVWDVYRQLGRDVRVLAKRELWGSRVAGPVVRALRAVPVERTSDVGRTRSFAAALTALQQGELVALAPEGTISRSFELRTFRTGAARLALAADVPIVPIVSWGSHRASTAGYGFRLRDAYRLPVLVDIGAPMWPEPGEHARAFTHRLRATMSGQLDRLQRDYPAGTPAGAWWVPARLGGGAPTPEQVERDR